MSGFLDKAKEMASDVKDRLGDVAEQTGEKQAASDNPGDAAQPMDDGESFIEQKVQDIIPGDNDGEGP